MSHIVECYLCGEKFISPRVTTAICPSERCRRVHGSQFVRSPEVTGERIAEYRDCDLTWSEIASITGLSVTTCRSRYKRRDTTAETSEHVPRSFWSRLFGRG